MNIRQLGRVGTGLALGTLLVFASACGSKGSSGSAVTISGTLALSSNMIAAQEAGAIKPLAVDSYGVRCVTLSGTPQAGEGTADSAGKFSLSLADATDVPIGCFIIKGTGDSAEIVAVVAFQSATTGLDGDKTREGSYVAGSGTSGLEFGTVTLDVTAGTATVDKTKVVATGGTEGKVDGTFADMTGNWKIQKPSKSPTGYAEVCAAGTQNCKGPSADEVVYFRYYTATDGTGGTHHGLSLWDSSAAYTACAGTNGGDGADLPSGWTAATGSEALTLPLNGLAGAGNFPDPGSVHVPPAGPDGHFVCDATSGQTCSAISAGWGLSQHRCIFYCALMNNFNDSGHDTDSVCRAEMHVDWANFGTQLGGVDPQYTTSWNLTADTSNHDYVSYLGGAIKFDNQPRQRFMFNELVVNGAVGTLNDHKDHSYTACKASNTGNGGCTTTVQCHSYENNRMTITQTSATQATVELVQFGQNDPANDSACDNVHDDDSNKNSKFFFNLVKQ